MKNKLMLLVLIIVLFSSNMFSQSSNIIIYTLKVRVDGNIMVNDKNKDVIVTIYKSDKVTALYSETISNVSTNEVGICKLKIGTGTPIITGNLMEYKSLDWRRLDYTVGFNWDGKDVRSGKKSKLYMLPYAVTVNRSYFIDTIQSQLLDTVVIVRALQMSNENIFNLNSLGFKNNGVIDNLDSGVIRVVADTTEITGILKFKNNQTIDNITQGQIYITADSTYISGKLKIDTLQSSTSADIIITKSIDLINNDISGIKSLNINPKTNSFSGVTTIGEVLMPVAGFASPMYIASDGVYKLSNNTTYEKSRCVALTTNTEIASSQPLLLHGYIKNPNWNFNKGDIIYINADTLSNIKPIIVEQFVQQVGYAVDINVIYFNPLEVKKINASVIISPAIQQVVIKNEKTKPLTVTEIPVAESRKWYYGTSATGPFDQYLSANDNKVAVQISFDSFNTYFVVCKSTLNGGEIITSNPIKVYCGQNDILPSDNQTLRPKIHSDKQLTVSTNPVATSYQWVYDHNENGTYSNEILDSTTTTFTPVFDDNGIYFVKCRAEINNTYIYSNVVRVFVSAFSLTPSDEQVVIIGESIKPISTNDELAHEREWLYSPNIDGPYSTIVPGTESNPQSISPNQFKEGVNYIICKSEGIPTNPVKVSVVVNTIFPKLQYTTQAPNVLSLDYGKVTPDSWTWYSGVDKNNITSPMNSSLTQTPRPMSMNDSLFYVVKTTYGTIEITSNIASIYSGLEISSAKKMVINKGQADTVKVKFRVIPDNIKWYVTGSEVELTNTLSDKSKLVPINAPSLTDGTYNIYCLGNYNRVMISSDTIEVVMN